MSVLITYDLSIMWTEVKSAALQAGFYETAALKNGGVAFLPNTTLVTDYMSAKEAVDLFVAIVRETSRSIIIHSVSAVEWNVGFHYEDPPRQAGLALGRLGLR